MFNTLICHFVLAIDLAQLAMKFQYVIPDCLSHLQSVLFFSILLLVGYCTFDLGFVYFVL